MRQSAPRWGVRTRFRGSPGESRSTSSAAEATPMYGRSAANRMLPAATWRVDCWAQTEAERGGGVARPFRPEESCTGFDADAATMVEGGEKHV